MKPRIARMSIAVVVGLGVLAGAIWVLTKTVGDHEALYQGKPLFYWAEQSNTGDAAGKDQARTVLEKEIFPQLTQVMFCDTNDSKLRLMLVEQLNGLPGVTIYFTDADGRRARAAANIGAFGSAASFAIPVLLRAVKGNDAAVQGAAIGALGNIRGQPDVIIPLLVDYLDNDHLNSDAAEALGNFGSAAKPAVPKLRALLKVPDKDLHHACVEALRKIDAEGAAPADAKARNSNATE